MKTIFTTTLFMLITTFLWAQAPQGIPYQAVMRNADGSVMSSSAVSLTFMIHDATATGTVVYQESHALNSNAQGLVSCVVGSGVASQGNFSNINWGGGAKFLQVMMGSTDLGTQQMLSVPYALHSGSADNAANATNATNATNAETAANGFSGVSQTGDTLYLANGNFIIVPGISAANYPAPLLGCTDGSACNFLANATQDDGSCLYSNATCDDGNANTSNDVINANCQCAGTAINTGNVVIGQDFQGGKVAYIFQPGDAGYVAGETHGLIAAAQDLPGTYQWGCFGTAISGADGQAIGTGAQNTVDIVNAGCGGAAQACANLVLNGYSDWFLPSRSELQQLYTNRAAIGGFQNDWYWSSSDYYSIYAWEFDFGSGTANSGVKGHTSYVRAVRAF
jgi:hypothetical protein